MRKKIGASLISLTVLLASLTACFSLPEKKQTTGTAATTPASGAYEALAALSSLAGEFSPSRASYSVEYTDPAIGTVLGASLSLVLSEGAFVLSYEYDRLNPIGSAEMTSREVGALSGAADELREAITGLYLFGVSADGLLLLSLDFPESAFSEVTAGEGSLLATVRDGAVEAVLGSDLGGAAALCVSVLYSETAISSLSLSYSLGSATVSVIASFDDE